MTNFNFLKTDPQLTDFVQQTEKSKAQMQQGLEQLELLYKSLMQKCFDGEIY